MVHLDHAACSHPKPSRVLSRVEETLRQPLATDAGNCSGPSEFVKSILDEVRAEAASLFGLADRRRVVCTLNATDALNMALSGLLQPGDHVVSTDVEHNAVARPLTHMQMKGQIALTRVEADKEGRVNPEAVAAALRHRTRLLVLAHGNSALGTLQPLEDLARVAGEKGVMVVVDAAHTGGVVPIHVDGWGLSAVALSGHTGLMGPAGTGLLLLGEGVRVRPLRLGESGADGSLSTHPMHLPASLEAGMPNVPGIAGLAEGLRAVREAGVDSIREHVSLLSKRFIGAIGLDERFRLFAARADLPRTGTVSFTLAGLHPCEVVEVMERRHGVVLASGLHGVPGVHQRLGTAPEGTVRASMGWTTAEDEVDRAVAGLRQVADAGADEARQFLQSPRGEVAGAP